MRRLWDSIRWRPVALFHIAWWWLKGAPKQVMGFDDADPLSRWEITKSAWRIWRSHIMYPHERDKYIPIEELIKSLKDESGQPPTGG